MDHKLVIDVFFKDASNPQCVSIFAQDPLRYLFRFLLPEGFPAHPHRGFETVTYVLRGGLVHRDSRGVKKSYGAPKASRDRGFGAKGGMGWDQGGGEPIIVELQKYMLYNLWYPPPTPISLCTCLYRVRCVCVCVFVTV